jgi:phosphotransferase system HPr (HPr) family protein
VKVARTFESEVRIHKGEASVDAKSVFDILTLKADYGTELLLEAIGTDAQAVIEELANVFQKDFDSGES